MSSTIEPVEERGSAGPRSRSGSSRRGRDSRRGSRCRRAATPRQGGADRGDVAARARPRRAPGRRRAGAAPARRKPAGSDQISALARVRTPASGPVPRGNQRSTCSAWRRSSAEWRRMSRKRRRAAAQLVVDPLHRRRHLLVIGLAHPDRVGRGEGAGARRRRCRPRRGWRGGNASRRALLRVRRPHSAPNAPDKKTPRPGGEPGRSSQPGPAIRDWPDPECRASNPVYAIRLTRV